MAAAESGADAFSASGTVAFQPAVGDLAAAETGADTASILGSILVAGLMAAAESGTDLASVLGPVSFKLSARRKRMKNVIPYRRPKATS